MKKFFHYCVFFLSFGVIAEAFAAGPWYYAEPLPSMRPEMPQHYDCANAQCRIVGINNIERVRATNGTRTRVDDVRMYLHFTCRGGYCTDSSGNELGVATHDGTVMGFFPLGYYVVSKAPGDNSFYQRGTGPYAADFPRIYIYGEEANDYVAVQPEIRYHNSRGLWCDNRADLCYFEQDGREVEVDRDELSRYFAMASVTSEESDNHWCHMERCDDNNGNFMGLNPFYHAYR